MNIKINVLQTMNHKPSSKMATILIFFSLFVFKLVFLALHSTQKSKRRIFYLEQGTCQKLGNLSADVFEPWTAT